MVAESGSASSPFEEGHTNYSSNAAEPASSVKADQTMKQTLGDSAAKGSSGLQTEIDPAAAMNRKLIYKANLFMVVKEYAQAQAEIRSVVSGSGGYVLSFIEEEHSGVWSGHFTAKVPSKGLTDLLNKLDQIPTITKNRSVEGTDVSEEYVDLEARLKVKEATEARLLEFLEKAAKTDDLVKFVAQLEKVQEEIEQAKGRMKYIDQNVALSTVDIDLSERKAAVLPLDEKKSLGASIKHTFGDSVDWVGSFLRGLLLFLVGALPIVAVVAVVSVPGYFIWRKKKRTSGSKEG